jgi:hypothetical protein
MHLWSIEQGVLQSQRANESVSLSCNQPHDVTPRLVPVRSGSGAVAALLVPPCSGSVVRNGVPLPSGVHVVRHKDRIDHGGETCWIAVEHEVRVSVYQPDVHGVDVYCFITKARLHAGEEIVVCPGRPGAECAAIYKKPAWDMALEANERFRCPRCGFDPAAADWQPTLPRKPNLPQLFELARQHARGGAT